MLSMAALFLAAASAASPALNSTSAWWEKLTYTISGDGSRQSCEYESSGATVDSGLCDDGAPEPIAAAARGATEAVTRITIERRFTPGGRPDPGTLETGDTLLGVQVMALAIDGSGTVRSCQVLAASGELRPAYGCDEATAERFHASAPRQSDVQRGFMTILVYGHQAHLA